MNLKPYPEYKDSGVEWLGEVPSHWAVQPATAIARVLTSTVDKKSYEGEVPVRLCNYTDVYYNEVICDDPSFMSATATAEQVRVFTPRAGDTAITKDSETANDIGISAYVPEGLPDVVFGYHLAIYRPRDIRYGRFIKRAFDSRYVKASLEAKTPGVTRVGLSQNAMKFIRLPVPPPVEAEVIAEFLDHETAEIYAFIADQNDLIRLLNERRAATITQAVTKGLDPNVPMKDSGVQWLGTGPVHWQVMNMKIVSSVIDCKHITAITSGDGEFPLASIREVQSLYVSLDNARRTTLEFYDLLTADGRKPRPGDLIISRNATVGQVALVSERHPPFAMGQDVALIRPLASVQDSVFLRYVLRSDTGETGMELSMIGSTFRRINVEDIKNLRIWVPPLSEQQQIADYLDHETAEIDAAIADAKEAIKLSKERRAALISAAVTGKIDVRDHQLAKGTA